MNAPLRQFASPYARKLARERGIALVDLDGSGPSGRVVAADVLAFVQPPAAESPVPAAVPPEPTPALTYQPAAVIAALATEIDLGSLQALVEQFANAQLVLSVDALLVRAAARSLAAIGINGGVGWETGKNEVVIAEAGSLSLGALQMRLDGGAAPAGEVALSVRCLKNSAIRAVSMPLRSSHRLRLVLSGDGGMVDCLLTFDAADVDEDLAVEFLVRFKDDLEMPLRLLA